MKFNDKYDTARPYTACYVVLMKENKIAMLLRKNTGWMDGHYGLPAGKLEYGETFTEGAIREAKEEIGVEIDPDDMRVIHVLHRHDEADGLFMDWVDVFYGVDAWQGEPVNTEPHMAESLEWIDINDLPENVIPMVKHSLTEIAKGNSYSEYGWAK